MVSKSIVAEHTIHLMNSSTMTIEESIVGNSNGTTGVLSIFCNGILIYRVQGFQEKSGKFKSLKKKESKITKKVAKVLLEAI